MSFGSRDLEARIGTLRDSRAAGSKSVGPKCLVLVIVTQCMYDDVKLVNDEWQKKKENIFKLF